MSLKDKLQIVLEVVTFPLACVWAFVDGWFGPDRIERALRRGPLRMQADRERIANVAKEARRMR